MKQTKQTFWRVRVQLEGYFNLVLTEIWKWCCGWWHHVRWSQITLGSPKRCLGCGKSDVFVEKLYSFKPKLQESYRILVETADYTIFNAKNSFSLVIFYWLTKFYCSTVFISYDIGQFVYCNCMLTMLWRHKFWI